jgi:primosomal protein N' (replication factor Y)
VREGTKQEFARRLRSNMTDAEQKLWRHIRRRQVDDCRFRRQHPVGPHIVDFICLEIGLVIELDGGQHDDPDADTVRSRFLAKHRYTTLRFWNNDVLANTDAVLPAIYNAVAVAHPHPNLPPQAGEGAKCGDDP